MLRCEATPNNLDDPHANLRSHEKTKLLIRKFDPGIIWDNYGVRDDVEVCSHYYLIFIMLSFARPEPCQPFTSHFPQADIHKLLTPDLLHQLITGTFKDHLVTWVENYLLKTHAKAMALNYIQEIDRR